MIFSLGSRNVELIGTKASIVGQPLKIADIVVFDDDFVGLFKGRFVLFRHQTGFLALLYVFYHLLLISLFLSLEFVVDRLKYGLGLTHF